MTILYNSNKMKKEIIKYIIKCIKDEPVNIDGTIYTKEDLILLLKDLTK